MSAPDPHAGAGPPPASPPRPRLSKSKYLAGLQCPRRVWLAVHQRDVGSAPDATTQAILDAGTEVGVRARGLFPGGVLVEEPAREHERAMAKTRRLLGARSVPALFEAAFEHEGVRIRVDVLERLSGGRWGLREVKSSGSVKDEHLDDLAIQLFVLRGAGLRVVSCELLHVDTGYVRGPNGVEWRRFFARAACTPRVAERLRALPRNVSDLHAVLARREAPEVEPGHHCHRPVHCEFWEHCTRGKPEDWLYRLPRLRKERFAELSRAGHERIGELPDAAPLSPHQERIRDAVRTGEPFVAPDLGEALAAAGPPAWYLDFETANPAIPLFEGTSPYQVIPFQWSLHHEDAAGRVTHRGFLAAGPEDPRRGVAEALLEALPDDGAPVLVYSPYESTCLGLLASVLPDLAPELERLRARLVDLLAVVRRCVYHPGFDYSYSLKSVAPALAPGFGWSDLDAVSDGGAAGAAWPRLARGILDTRARAQLQAALLAYCRRDTEALLATHRALRGRS